MYECWIVCNCTGCDADSPCWAEKHAVLAISDREALDRLEPIADELDGILIGRVEQC